MSIWQHSWKDAYLVVLAAIQSGVFAACYLAHLRGAVVAQSLLAAVLVFLICTNVQCVAHNFLHLPFFRARWMNRLFAVWNTLLIGVPQTLYKYHHLNHHRFNSDRRGPDGTTQDFSSIYRYARGPEQAESIFRYTFLSPLRTDVVPLWKAAAAHGEGRRVVVELVTLVAFAAAIAWASPSFTLFVYLPVWYLGQATAYGENYLEHFGADPSHRKTDSVSCYSRWYNWIWFNNGYHQEHHWRPQVHWTHVPLLTDELPDSDHRRVVRISHWINWPIFSSFSRAKGPLIR